jgi:hypothetical protein
MTPAIATLRERLAAVNSHSEHLPLRIDTTGMAAERRRVEALANRTANGAGASKNRIVAAVETFRHTGQLADVRTARLVCWGIVEHPTCDEPILIEDQDRFSRLLRLVDGYRSDQRPYRRCWRGLLHGYLVYDPGEHVAGRTNWHSLRDYLTRTREIAIGGDFKPDWAIAIAEHPNLLTADPCSRYARAVFDGDDSILDPLRYGLGLNDDMWLSRALVEAQIADALGRPDIEFKQIMPRILAFLGKYQNLQDQGLARVLNRYAEMANPEIDIELRDYTVARWGNPWLQANAAKWHAVSDAGRRMVSSWLKLEFIRAFFELLSDDGLSDRRRLRFWEKYVDEIDDMYFALGGTARENRNPDFVKSRKAMNGRLLNLDQAGSPKNNAFIMMIKGHVFVEFGEKGNALFIFGRDSLPFDLSRRAVAGNTTAGGLKSPKHVDRILHQSKHGHEWEARFAAAIKRLTGVEVGHRVARAAVRPNPLGGNYVQSAPSAAMRMPPPVNNIGTDLSFPKRYSSEPAPEELHRLFAQHKILFTDNRDKGGACWAYVPNSGDERSKLLPQWGFVWSGKRRAWYRNS